MPESIVKTYTLGRIGNQSTSPEQLFVEGIFPHYGCTLLEVRKDYLSSFVIRDDINESYCEGEVLADFVETNGAKELSKGRVKVIYVQRPDGLETGPAKKGCVAEYVAAIGGKRISYICPPEGWAIPSDGVLYHPKTGAAIATVGDREKAVRLNAKHIECHEKQFADWTIPSRWLEEFYRIFKEKVDIVHPTPEQLAEFITSYQWPPVKGSGLRAVVRHFSSPRECCGPFGISLGIGPRDSRYTFGARRRSEQ